MLTPYDEFPVHQAPYTFSHIPSTDYNWDDGHYFGVFSPDDGAFLATGTRIMKQATVHLENKSGGQWRVVFEAISMPWIVQTMGYHPGSWRDGGTFFTYHGSEERALEWDQYDFSIQPFDYTPNKVQGEQAATNFGEGTGTENGGQKVQGPEYLARVITHAPDGSVSTGAAQVELFINGPNAPYGFE